MSDNAKIIKKIRKLITLANDAGAAENEAMTAMRQAHKLLAKHNLQLEDISDEDKNVRSVHDSIHPGYRWARDITYAIADLYFCKIVFYARKQRNHFRYSFIGREANAVTAAEIAKYVVLTLKREAARGRRKHGSAWQTSFLHGASHRVATRCREMVKEMQVGTLQLGDGVSDSKAMVLASVYDEQHKLNDEYIELHHSTARPEKRRQIRINDTDGYWAGQASGNKVTLRHELEG